METIVQNPEKPTAYEPVIYHTLQEADVQRSMQSFQYFLQLPLEQRVKIFHVDETKPRTGRSGYSYKGTNSPDGSARQDNKHIFHMTQDLERYFEYPSVTHKLPMEARMFMAEATRMHHQIIETAGRTYEKLESDLPGIYDIHFPYSGKNGNHTRFLAYEAPESQTLAAAHYDKGTGTIAVAESHGGLRVGYGPDDLTAVEREGFLPVFFPGYGYNQLAEMMGKTVGRRAAWHDVIDTEQRVSETVARWALIHFINPAYISLESTTEQTHTPIPWRGLGSMALRSDDKSFMPN